MKVIVGKAHGHGKKLFDLPSCGGFLLSRIDRATLLRLAKWILFTIAVKFCLFKPIYYVFRRRSRLFLFANPPRICRVFCPPLARTSTHRTG